MMEYYIDRDTLYSLIFEEVSRVADEAYDDTGASLYDAVIITSKDDATIERMEDDAIDALVKRTVDIATQSASLLSFDVPDFKEDLTDATYLEITRYISLNVCAAWFQSRMPSKVEEYTLRSQAAMDKAVTYLKTIKPPKRA